MGRRGGGGEGEVRGRLAPADRRCASAHRAGVTAALGFVLAPLPGMPTAVAYFGDVATRAWGMRRACLKICDRKPL
jgi:hypothetical protein